MPSNDFDINTDDYDLYNSQGVPSALPGTPIIDGSGHLEIPRDPYFSPSTLENSTMDKDPRNTGPTTDFWDNYPLTIDINGYIFYYNENTGINIRGPEGAPQYVSFDSLTPEEGKYVAPLPNVADGSIFLSSAEKEAFVLDETGISFRSFITFVMSVSTSFIVPFISFSALCISRETSLIAPACAAPISICLTLE